MRGWGQRLGALATIAALWGIASPAAGQTGLGQRGAAPGGFGQGALPGGTGGKPKKGAVKKVPEGEEQHAATNADGLQALQTQEPSLPQNPLEVPPEVKKRIGTDFDRDPVKGLGIKTERDWYGLYYQEKSGSYRFRTLFPLWAERKLPEDRASIFGFYYNRRSKHVDADVLFPLFMKLREKEVHSTLVGPYFHRESPGGEKQARHDNWLFPLFFEGKSADGSGYFHSPPLLTYSRHSSRDGLNITGPMFCKWKGGPACDPRTTDSIDLGIAPFYFYGKDQSSEYEIIPPLLHYYRYSEIGDKSFNLWGPVLIEHSPERDVVDVIPFFFRSWGKNESSTTVLPLFHYSYKGNATSLITPLFLNNKNEKGDTTFVTWGYARYRGRTQLDMVTPFFWSYRDPDIGLDRKLLFPLFYKNTSPRSDDLVVFPFYGHFNKPGLSESTWITPLVRTATSVSGWDTQIFPIFYAGRKNQSSHLVVAPFLWDFSSSTSRTTLAAPFYFRHQDEKTISQLAFNTYYREKKVPGGLDWEFHFFPLFSYGQSPTGNWWNVLYGLAGYAHEGTMARIKLLYVPIKLSE